MPEFFRRLFERFRKARDRFPVIHDTARVVGRVDEHGAGVFAEHRFQFFKIYLESIGIALYRHKARARRFGKDLVFGEIRRERDHFVPFLAQSGKRDRQRRSRADRHINVILVRVFIVIPADMGGDRAAHKKIALRGGIAVQRSLVRLFDEF